MDAVEEHSHDELGPGTDCPTCGRKIPKVRADAPTGARREVMTVAVPKGEEGVLENMLIALVDRHKDIWPRDFAHMREQVGLEVVGGRSWKYFALHFAVYAALTLDIQPSEEGG